jgi:hypothetical protein
MTHLLAYAYDVLYTFRLIQAGDFVRYFTEFQIQLL